MNRRLTDHAPALLRFYIGGNAVIAWYNAIGDSRSLLGESASRIDGGTAILWVMALLGLCIMADVAINDIMSAKYKWKHALKQRHILLSSLFFCYIAHPFISSMSNRAYPLTLYCIWHASIIVLATFIDAKKRQRELECATLRS